ncbi:MAG: odhI 1 [Gemmataceae bacterium]|nr:odhI 1 [Gemmataceae bacterium]
MATCPKCQLPNPDSADTCNWCGQHRFEPDAAQVSGVAVVASAAAGEEQSGTPPLPASGGSALAPPQFSSPLVASFLTPNTTPPEHKPLPSHVGLLFARSAGVMSTAAPAPAAEKTAGTIPGRPPATQAGVIVLPNPAAWTVPTSTPTPPQIQPKLVVIRGQKINCEYPVYGGRNVIGRFADKPVDIDLFAQEAEGQIWSSRYHAAITFDRNLLLIEDLNSLNGTWVNGVRLHAGQQRPLKPNDVIQIGTVQLKVVAG